MAPEKKELGWVKIWRSTLASEIWSKPPHYIKLWLWLIASAAHKDTKQMGYFLKRGQLLTSYKQSIEAIKWKVGYRYKRNTYDEIRRAYEHLREDNMITYAKATPGIIVTICNYDKYQRAEIDESQNDARVTPELRQTPATPRNKNVKNERIKEVEIRCASDGEKTASDAPRTRKRTFDPEGLKNYVNGRSVKFCQKFERVWDLYPNKIGKKEAARHWNASVNSDADVESIAWALDQYKAHLNRHTWKQVQNGKTWFNNWRDWLEHEDMERHDIYDPRSDAPPKVGQYFHHPKTGENLRIVKAWESGAFETEDGAMYR